MPYEDYDDDDDGYDYDDHHGYSEDKYKHYFKFDPDAWDAWGKWLYDALNDIVETSPNVWYIGGFPQKSVPVNGYNPIYGESKKAPSYIGNNQHGEPIWKNKYFVEDKIQQAYNKHITAHAKYFVSQPNYYKGMFDILN
jgi:hypothetical protein